jgi:hypothetical protein
MKGEGSIGNKKGSLRRSCPIPDYVLFDFKSAFVFKALILLVF